MAEGQPGGLEPVYLTLEDVLELHALIIGATAVEAADQLCNKDGLESALARPETYAHYQEANIALQAAVLAHGIAEGQQFIDGNKPTALIAMLTFLEINDWHTRHQTANWRTGYSVLVPVRPPRASQNSWPQQCTALNKRERSHPGGRTAHETAHGPENPSVRAKHYQSPRLREPPPIEGFRRFGGLQGSSEVPFGA